MKAKVIWWVQFLINCWFMVWVMGLIETALPFGIDGLSLLIEAGLFILASALAYALTTGFNNHR